MNYEEKILTYLVENYRKSKKDLGDNKTNRRTQVKPEKMYKKYNANDGDFEEITKLNLAVENLIKLEFVYCTKETFGTQIQSIFLMDERVQDAEEYLTGQYGYISKDTQLKKLKHLIDTYQRASSICEKECAELSDSMKKRKIPKNLHELDDVFKAVAFIEKNQEELYLREMSMKVYGDSKYFEEITSQSVCNMLRKHSQHSLKEGELQDEILLLYHIAKEPQKLCIKGKAILTMSGIEVDISGFQEGIEFRASDLENLESVKLLVPNFMTIENRTSYLRYHKEDTVVFYLGGYGNRFQRDFIKNVYASNKEAHFYHFGDIDAGGFWIHQNLCEITGVNFELFGMSLEELKKSEFATCLHSLSTNDRTRLQELKKYKEYEEVISYMLQNNVKMEQEIVSLELMKVK